MKFRIVEDINISSKNSKRFFAQVYRPYSDSWKYIQMYRFESEETFLTPEEVEDAKALKVDEAKEVIQRYKDYLSKKPKKRELKLIKTYE